ncbi:hypothetical protein NDU88_006806 [Pleurodeles waltl]|uniref:Uncharacterized protein n=1 Tax=Pleurodeles waltl TaxID=8319 RepID=A0AAV7PJF8_PLEWA|nr:hypothetical protein NDU88_006806 [Pleurodeles waltl]
MTIYRTRSIPLWAKKPQIKNTNFVKQLAVSFLPDLCRTECWLRRNGAYITVLMEWRDGDCSDVTDMGKRVCEAKGAAGGRGTRIPKYM